MKMKTELTVHLELTKAELTLITKALCGKLRPGEESTAKDLGLSLLDNFQSDMDAKAQAATHAVEKAQES